MFTHSTRLPAVPEMQLLGMRLQSLPEALATTLYAKLAMQQRLRFDAAGDPAVQRRMLLAQALLMVALRRLQAPDGMPQRLVRAHNGRPELPAPWDCSFSHSGDWVVCAVARGARIGVDIERMGTLCATDLPHYFSAGECDWAGASVARCYQLWTRKEATAKGDGGGLRRMRDISVRADRAVLDGVTWSLHALQPDGVTLGCLAIRTPAVLQAIPALETLSAAQVARLIC